MKTSFVYRALIMIAFSMFLTAFAGEKATNPKIDSSILTEFNKLESSHALTRNHEVTSEKGVRVIVQLVNENDVSFESLDTSRSADTVHEIVRGEVDQIQNRFFESLITRGLMAGGDQRVAAETQSAFEPVLALDYQYAVAGYVADRALLEKITELPEVKFIELDKLNKLHTIEGRNLTYSTQAAAQGHTGSGIGVAVVDSHFDLLHPELGGSTSLPNSVVKGGQNFSDPGTSIHSRVFDDCFHGTGTASIVKRYAPGSDLYALTVFPNAYDSVIANAINWCITNKNGVGGGAPIKIISMSLGGGRHYSQCNSGTVHQAAGSALANGILVFAASGNDGWTNSMGSPACSSNVISVGSTWDQNGAGYSPFPPAYCSDNNRQQDERACYSDTASFLDIYAPSERVVCARCGGGTAPLGGTSSACPAAAGLTAQLLDFDSSLAGNKNAILTLYNTHGTSVIGDSGKKRIDLDGILNGGGGSPGGNELQNGASQSLSVASGATQQYTVNIPSGASNFTVTISGNGDLDLYVKSSPVNWPSDQGAHNTSTFKAPYQNGSSESVTFASPAAGTWHVLVHGYAAGSGSIVASWSTGGGGNPSWQYETISEQTPHNYANNRTYQFTYEKAGASQVGVHFARLDTETNYDFVSILDANGNEVYKVSGNLISSGSGSAFGRSDGWAIVSGSKITVRLVTDYSVTDWGYQVDEARYIQ